MRPKNILVLLLIGLTLSSCKQSYLQLSVMTYNVRHCSGMDYVVDYDRTAGVIAKQQPDIVALQELDSVTGRSGHHDQLAELASRTGYYPVFGRAIDYDGGCYGVGILSRECPISSRCIPLPGEEPRVLLVVELKDYVIACTHLDLEKEARLASVPLIVEESRQWEKPFILAGDWNDTPGSALLKEMKKDYTILSGDSPSYPADTPEECIDFIAIFNNHTAKVMDYHVIDEPEASDHRPIMLKVLLRVTMSLVS